MGKTVGNLWDFSGKLEKKGTQGFLFERRWEHLEEIDGIGGKHVENLMQQLGFSVGK